MSDENSHVHFLPPHSRLAKVDPLPTLRKRLFYSRRLERLWTFIEEYYSDPDIHLANAAKCSGVSADHLNLLLHRFGETTFHALLMRYRVEKSLGLLSEKNYTLTEAYSRCGFNSSTTFSRQFKKWVGCLPSEYRRLMRDANLKECGATDLGF